MGCCLVLVLKMRPLAESNILFTVIWLIIGETYQLTGSSCKDPMYRYAGVIAKESRENPKKVLMLPWLVTKDLDHSYNFGF